MRDKPDTIEIKVKMRRFKNFLKVLDNPAMVTSYIKTPQKIVALHRRSSCVLVALDLSAMTEPYIPSQNRMVIGLNNDIKKPEIKDLIGDSYLLVALAERVCALSMLSMPV